VGRHIVALEEDNELFSSLFVSMIRSPAVTSPPHPKLAHRSQDPIPARIKKRRASK
jgi:hypothetical protein